MAGKSGNAPGLCLRPVDEKTTAMTQQDRKDEEFIMRTSAFVIVFATLAISMAVPAFAQGDSYRIEVLQVADVPTLNDVYTSFVSELGKNGIVERQNLVVNRTVIDFDVEKAGLWKKASLLHKLKGEASRIADARPDLALTIGSPATLYTKDKIIAAGVPLVFSGVSFPVAAGCRSLEEAGPGFTGSSTYMNPKDALQIMQLAFPGVTSYGVIHSDDDAAMSHAADIGQAAPGLGLTILEKQVSKNDPIEPAARELIAAGARVFIIPLDTYYGMRNNQPARELAGALESAGIPLISFVNTPIPGAVLYVGSDFGYVGGLSAQQAVR